MFKVCSKCWDSLIFRIGTSNCRNRNEASLYSSLRIVESFLEVFSSDSTQSRRKSCENAWSTSQISHCQIEAIWGEFQFNIVTQPKNKVNIFRINLLGRFPPFHTTWPNIWISCWTRPTRNSIIGRSWSIGEWIANGSFSFKSQKQMT